MSYTLVETNGVITLDTQGAGHLFRVLPDLLLAGNITVNGTLSGGGVLTNPMTTLGDIITGGAAGTPTRLAVGSNTQVLTVVAGVPAWAAAGGGGGTSITNGGGTVAVSSAGAITDTPASGQNDTLTLAGGGSFNSTGGVFNVNVSSNFASNLNTGTSTGGVSIGNTAAGALALASGAASTFQVTSANLTLGTLTSGTTALTSAGVLTLTGAGASTWSLTAGALVIQNASANLTLQTTTSGTLAVTGVAALTLTGGAASTWSVTAGGLTINATSADLILQTTTSGDVELEPASAGNILANLLGGGAFLLAGGQASLTPTETVASAAGAVWDGLTVPATTLTLTGNTNITNATGLNLVTIGQPTMSAAQALTITNPTTLAIIGPPLMGGAGPASGTNIRSFWVQAGSSLFAGLVTGTLGLTVAGAVVSLNASSNFATTINTGTSTGAVTIGNAASTSAVNIAGNAASTWQITSASLTVGTLTSGTTAVTSAGVLTLTGAAASTWSLTAGALIIQNAAANLTLQTTTSGTLALTSAGALNHTSAAASTYSNVANTALALQVTDGTTAYWALDTRNTVTGVVAHSLSASPPTIASAAGVTYSVVSIPTVTTTLTGSTLVTALNGLALNIARPTVTDASAETITTASTVYIAGAPIVGGSITYTNPAALQIAQGQIFAPDGTVGLPSYSFASDKTSGIFFTVGNKIISLVSQGSQVLYASAAGTISSQILTVIGGVTLQGSNPLTMGDGANMAVGSSTGTKIGTATTQKIGFWNTAPIVQPSAVGTATGYAAGATAATFHSDDTYTGNVGSTAYTLNGIVAALKNVGLIAS